MPTAGRTFSNVALAVVGFALTLWAVEPWVPLPNSYGLRAKVEHFKEHHGRYDAVFFGTSLTFRAVIPEVVDRHLADVGVEQTSYNFGLPGANAFELYHVIDEVLGEVDRPMRVYLEHTRWTPRTLDRAEVATDRSVYWHSFDATRLVVRCAATLDLPRTEKARLIWLHLKRMARRHTHYAKGGALISEWLEPTDVHDYLSADETDRDRGYQDPEILLQPGSTNVDAATARQRRNKFHAELKQYEAAVARARSTGRKRTPGGLAAVAERDRIGATAQAEAITSRGHELTVFVHPALGDTEEAFDLRDAGVYPELIALTGPSAFPALYRSDHRFDRAHLNRRGALAFSRAFAEQYARRKGTPRDD